MHFHHIHTEIELRNAWRRIARTLHPDAHPSDPYAEERFKSAHIAFYRALKRIRTTRRGRKPSFFPRSRWECPRCEESFTYGAQCYRCCVPLRDSTNDNSIRLDHDPAVESLIKRLERPRKDWTFPIPSEMRPMLAAFGFILLGLTHWNVGILGGAILLFGFALVVVLLDGYERFRRAFPEPWRQG